MKRRAFLQCAAWGALLRLPSVAASAAAFSPSERRLVAALVAVMLPADGARGSGAAPNETLKLLLLFLGRETGARRRFQLGLKRLRRTLSSSFPTLSAAAAERRLAHVWTDAPNPDARFALDLIRRSAATEFFLRREGRDFLNTPFRTLSDAHHEPNS
jgi:hypothetical protein